MGNDETGQGRQGLYAALAKVLYLAVGIVLLLWFFHLTRYVLLASVLALILAIALNAPVVWLERKNVSRAPGTAISFLVLLAVGGGVGWIVLPRLAEEVPQLIDEIPDLVDAIAESVTAFLGEDQEVSRQILQLSERVDDIWRYTDEALGGLALAIFVIALALYMVVYLRPLLHWYVRSMPPRLRDPATRAFARASGMVIGWVYATLILGGIKAVAAFLFLAALGIPGAAVWSLLAFTGALVPQVGFYVMTIPPVLMALSLDPLLALWTLLYFVAFSEFLGRFVAPWIYAETMDLNPVYVLFMIIAIGYAFGLVGVLIATPVAGFIKAYYDEFYLYLQPEVAGLEGRIEAMMERTQYPAEESGENSG